MKILFGNPSPLGHHFDGEKHNFAVFSDSKTRLQLNIYDEKHAQSPLCSILMNKTEDVYHVALSDLDANFTYTFGIENVEVFDPYAKKLTTSNIWGEHSFHIKSYPSYEEEFDWENVKKPSHDFSSLIIYEMHVRGFNAKSNDGTYEAIIDKITYLKQLGINAIELLPIHAFDETQTPFPFSPSGYLLYNYWGYNSLSFFEPKRSYARKDHCPIKALKNLVKECHKNGIEVILDVVYNHTSSLSPLIHLAPSHYYLLDQNKEHTNYTGCGNTLNCNNPQCMSLILDSLRYFAENIQIDGFRFDLASIFCRTEQNQILLDPPILEAISLDPILSKCKLIAEPWDAAGFYQVGSFPSKIFAEWNGQYRDTVRQFVKGDAGKKEAFIQALIGSKSTYYGKKSPFQSINFITCHDGFTLMDLLSYNTKHNKENGEQSRDGCDWNNSWNCGVEGPSDDELVLRLREKQFCNHLVALLLSQGTPMLLMGDEIGTTHFGNNNAYCQDRNWNWFDWDDVKQKSQLLNFVKKLISLRKELSFISTKEHIEDHDLHIYNESILYGKAGSERFVAFDIFNHLFYTFNANNFPVTLKLPTCKDGYVWKVLVYTGNKIDESLYLSSEAAKIKSPVVLAPYTSLVMIQDI